MIARSLHYRALLHFINLVKYDQSYNHLYNLKISSTFFNKYPEELKSNE